MKTIKGLNALKEEVEPLNKKLCELTDEQLELVTGGEDRQIDDTHPPRGWTGE